MTTLNPGTGGTLKATTLENAIQEILVWIIATERDIAKNPNQIRNITSLSWDLTTRLFSASYTIPVIKNIDATGNSCFQGKEYLTNDGFIQGSGGDLLSTGAVATLLEISERIQTLENDLAKNPDSKNFVGGTFNTNSLTYSGSVSAIFKEKFDTDGEIIFEVEEYLL